MVQKKKWKLSNERQIELTQSVVTFIAKDLIPVSVVESSAIKELLEKAEPCFSMPSRKYLCGKLLPEKCKAVYEDIKVHSSEFYFHKPITVHIELYFCYRFIHFLQSVGQY